MIYDFDTVYWLLHGMGVVYQEHPAADLPGAIMCVAYLPADGLEPTRAVTAAYVTDVASWESSCMARKAVLLGVMDALTKGAPNA